MEGKRKAGHRSLRRCYQGSRLEDQLWAMAYEHVWPLVCRAAMEGRPGKKPLGRDDTAEPLARRA
jgi:hypothetical protein